MPYREFINGALSKANKESCSMSSQSPSLLVQAPLCNCLAAWGRHSLIIHVKGDFLVAGFQCIRFTLRVADTFKYSLKTRQRLFQRRLFRPVVIVRRPPTSGGIACSPRHTVIRIGWRTGYPVSLLTQPGKRSSLEGSRGMDSGQVSLLSAPLSPGTGHFVYVPCSVLWDRIFSGNCL